MQKRAKTSKMRAFDKTHWTEGGETLSKMERQEEKKTGIEREWEIGS